MTPRVARAAKLLEDVCRNAVTLAEMGRSRLGKRELYENVGMSGHAVRHLINNVCSAPGTKYLEVGLYRGSTFFSALCGNTLTATGIDDWTEFEGPRQEFEKNVADYVGKSDIGIYNCDFRKLEINEESFEKYNTYFYDGGHSHNDHRDALTKLLPALADPFIYMVDDYNQDEVRSGTQVGIEEAGLLATFCTRLGADRKDDAYGWWNGLLLSVLCRKEKATNA
jgi:hypothetical protein